MKNISKKVKILAVVSICLWIVGSFLIFNDMGRIGASISVLVIIIAGLYSQVIKDRKEKSKL